MTYRVRTNVTGLKAVRSRLEKVFSEILKDSSQVNEIGDALAEEHKRLLRTGVSPATSSRLKPLTKETKKKRNYLSKYNATHEKFSAGKSNLTFTGQLVEAITFKFVNPNRFDIFVKSDRREPYSGKSGPYSSNIPNNIPNNAEVAKYQKEMGRPMLGITEKMRGIVNRLVIRNLRRLLRRR